MDSKQANIGAQSNLRAAWMKNSLRPVPRNSIVLNPPKISGYDEFLPISLSRALKFLSVFHERPTVHSKRDKMNCTHQLRLI